MLSTTSTGMKKKTTFDELAFTPHEDFMGNDTSDTSGLGTGEE